jgi:hypothetical protein
MCVCTHVGVGAYGVCVYVYENWEGITGMVHPFNMIGLCSSIKKSTLSQIADPFDRKFDTHGHNQ